MRTDEPKLKALIKELELRNKKIKEKVTEICDLLGIEWIDT